MAPYKLHSKFILELSQPYLIKHDTYSFQQHLKLAFNSICYILPANMNSKKLTCIKSEFPAEVYHIFQFHLWAASLMKTGAGDNCHFLTEHFRTIGLICSREAPGFTQQTPIKNQQKNSYN